MASTAAPSLRSRALRGIALALAGTSLVLGVSAFSPASAPADESASSQADFSMYEPRVTFKEDGTAVQRVPSVSSPVARDDASYVMEMPNYNTYFLQADARGCGACHDDLGKVIDESAYGFHHKLSNGLGIEITLQQCLSCHNETRSFSPDQNLGSMLHGIHRQTAECMDCHEATNDGAGLTMWDFVKYEQMRGITSVASDAMEQNFTYRTDEVVSTEDLYDVN